MSHSIPNFDVLVVGGGPAGLSAALYLGRARKSVAVVDAGRPRHAVSDGVHNFLTREGMPPATLRAEAWAQMAAYPTVHHVDGAVVRRLERQGDRWLADAGDAGTWAARAVLLAPGIVDEHPEIPGYRERWGRSIHHCPYCHGWEMRDLPLAALARGEAASHLAPLLRGWTGDVAVVSHGETLEPSVQSVLEAANIPIYTQRIVALEGPGSRLEAIRFADGSNLERRGLFVKPTQRQVALVAGLDLDLDEHGYVTVDEQQRTSLAMLWAAGDLTARQPQQVVEAVATGGRAAGSINAALTLP